MRRSRVLPPWFRRTLAVVSIENSVASWSGVTWKASDDPNE